jgi:SAM-dependent methyltransferase
MTSWSEGYVSDIAYSIGYYREMAPAHLAFAALSLGKNPGLAKAPKRVLELGFGMGLGFVLGAAANPACHYEGCDFNPEHVAHARALAEDAGLTNISLREASFQDLAAEAREGQHDLDIIQLHGILTWVSAEAHHAIVEIARKRLKPGGMLYVSYNCLPGWAGMLPVQRLMRERGKRVGGNSLAKTSAAIAVVNVMMESKARFFDHNPAIGPRIEKFKTLQPSYLAHEYLNENWFIFNFADVVELMGGAKLSYLGSATISENLDAIAVPAEMQALVAEAGADTVWKETLRDFAINKQFRRDIYVRGLLDLNGFEVMQELAQTSFTLSMLRSAVPMKLAGPLGELDLKAEVYGPLLDLLGDRVVPFNEIVTAMGARGVAPAGVLQALALLSHAGHVLPIIGGANADLKAGKSFNRMLGKRARRGRMYSFIAAPLARTGIVASATELLALDGIFEGLKTADKIAEHVVAAMVALGINPVKDGQAITEPEAAKATVTADVATFVADKLPVWRKLGVV